MAGAFKEKFKAGWGKLSPAARTSVSIALLFGGSALLAAFILPKNKNAAQNTTAHQQLTSETNLILPQGKDTSLESLKAGQESIKTDLIKAAETQAQKDRLIDDLKKQLADMQGKKLDDQQGPSEELVKEMARISSRLDDLEKERGAPRLTDPLPSDIEKGPVQTQEASVVAKPKMKMRIIGAIDKKPDVAAEESKPIPYLPPGALFEVNLINGMDAPTSSVTQKNPVPALVRIKTDAILPNLADLDIKECFAIVSGFGVMATERAQLRTETISCVKESGEVLESKLDGYVVGEDGKVGLRGRLVSRQGSLLAKSLISGFLGGFAQNMVPSPVPQMNIAPGLTQQYQTPNVGAAAQAGMAKGASDSARMMSQFYLDMAKEEFPVIEIDAGRRATIILLHGVELLPIK